MSPCLAGALVGFGGVAERGHLPGYRRDPRFAIRAVCDPDIRRGFAPRMVKAPSGGKNGVHPFSLTRLDSGH